jgi:hypothetical protein
MTYLPKHLTHVKLGFCHFDSYYGGHFYLFPVIIHYKSAK